jgi:predicted SAM-dependent methyltransferase
MSEKYDLKTVDDLFNFYSEIKDESDEYKIKLKFNEDIFETHTSSNLIPFIENSIVETKRYDEKHTKSIIKYSVVEKFHPNNIDNKKFWETAKKKFPLFSVNGTYSQNIEECNFGTFKMAENFGVLEVIDLLISNSGNKINLFEIGYGHGNLFEKYNEKVNYIGIDYFKIDKLKQYKNLLTIKKSGIPKKIKKESQDLIYSFNVLQHCSQKDRFEYFKQSYEKLKRGGLFIGGMFLETEKNKDEKYWGVEDLDGRKYTHFFTQLTEVDTEDEFYNFVRSLGFKVFSQCFYQNYCAFVMIKM